MVTIVGGGIFGLAIGWYLARANYPVTILERDQVGHGATWSAAGMLMPWKLSSAFSQALFELQRESHSLWPRFAAELAICSDTAINYRTDGRYFVALDSKAVKRFRKQYVFHRRAGFPLEWLSGEEVRCREPNLGPKVQAAMFSSFGHQVNNRRLIIALKEAFIQAGGTIHEQTPVSDILIENSQVQGVRLAESTLVTGTVILAAGAWSGQIGGLPLSLQGVVQPLKGQTLTLQTSAAEPLLRQPVIGPVYLVPRSNGRLIIGTTVEEDAGFDTHATAAGILDVLRKAQDIVPAIKELPVVEMGAGLRPTGPDRLPVVGPTEVQGLILATGGHSYGILLSPIVAQVISQLVLTGQMPESIKPFTPSRRTTVS